MRLDRAAFLCVFFAAVTPAWAASPGSHDADSLSGPLLRYVVLLSVATAMVLLVRRLRLPNLIGEIAASFLLGASVLGVMVPSWFHWLTDSTPVSSKVLEFIGLLGILFLLLKTGFEVDIDEFKSGHRVRQALMIGGLAFLLPFTLVFLLTSTLLGLMPASASEQHWKVALCLAATTSMPAMVVIAKLLDDLKLTGSGPSVIILSSYLVLDLIAFVGFSIVRGITSNTATEPEYFLFLAIGCVVGVVLALTVGRWLFDTLSRTVSRRNGGDGFWVIATAIAITAVSLGALTDHFGLTKIPGFFLAGMMAGGLEESMKKRVSEFGCYAFTPVYFAMVGLHINLWTGVRWEWVLTMLCVPIAGKILGGYLGARVAGIRRVYVPVVAVSCGAMGAVEIVAANVFLSDKLFTQPLFNSVVLAVVLSLLFLPKLLSHAMKRWEEVDVTTLLKAEHVRLGMEANTLTEAFDMIGGLAAKAGICPENEKADAVGREDGAANGRELLRQCLENNGLVGGGVATAYLRRGKSQTPELLVIKMREPLTLLESRPVTEAAGVDPALTSRRRGKRRAQIPKRSVDVPLMLPEDEKPIRWIFCAFVRKRDSGAAVRILSQVLSIVRAEQFASEASRAGNPEELTTTLLAIDQNVNN